MRGDVDGGHDVTVATPDGHGDGAQTLLELLVDQRPALIADRPSSARSAPASVIVWAVRARRSARSR